MIFRLCINWRLCWTLMKPLQTWNTCVNLVCTLGVQSHVFTLKVMFRKYFNFCTERKFLAEFCWRIKLYYLWNLSNFCRNLAGRAISHPGLLGVCRGLPWVCFGKRFIYWRLKRNKHIVFFGRRPTSRVLCISIFYLLFFIPCMLYLLCYH